MTHTARSASRNKVVAWVFAGLAIFIGFPIWLIRLGVDYFLMVAPVFLFFYGFVASLYVGFLAASFAKFNGRSAWLWAVIAIALTVGSMVAVNMIDPQYTLYGCFLIPFGSIPLSLLLIRATRPRKA